MIHTTTEISGLIILEPRIWSDERGFFFESWNQEKYLAYDIPSHFVQDNISCSHKNVLRGLHLQDPHPQGKLVSVLQGTIYDVAVDLRPQSPTYGQWHGLILSESNRKQFYIPEGFAHGFLSLADNTLISYKCTSPYNPQTEKTIIWNDPSLNINWHDYYDDLQSLIISPKDQQGITIDLL